MMRVQRLLLGGALAAAALVPAGQEARGSSHREAPFITGMPKVDGTDFYMFNSYEPGREGNVTIVANYLPLQDPYGGPNYFELDPEALYEIHIDNNGDATEDLTFQFRFDQTLKGVQLPVGDKMVAVPLVNVGPVTADDQSAANIERTYELSVVRGDRRTGERSVATLAGEQEDQPLRQPLDNIGTKSTPDYEDYARAHIYEVNVPGCDAGPARVFVGQRRESFAVALGQIFDLLNLPNPIGDRDQGLDVLSDKNITTLALEVPSSCLVTEGSTIIGGWTTASVRQARAINPEPTFENPAREGGAWTQVSRLGMPLVNEVVIGLPDKNRFNSSHPSQDGQFIDYVTNPTLPELVEIVFGAAGVVAPDAFPRADLVAVFLTGVEGVNQTATPSEMLRLNTGIPATARDDQNSLGAAACFVGGALVLDNAGCDPAGFPNGRRPGDDVVDISLRVAMGYLLDAASAPAGQLPYTDGAIVESSRFDNRFPYLRTPRAGSEAK